MAEKSNMTGLRGLAELVSVDQALEALPVRKSLDGLSAFCTGIRSTRKGGQYTARRVGIS
jgi:hypothetical protein